MLGKFVIFKGINFFINLVFGGVVLGEESE